MSYLYICEQGATVGYEGSRFYVRYKDDMLKSIPGETLETIEVFGNIQLTTQCIAECLKRGVNVAFYSSKGSYYGRLTSTNHVNVNRQRIQAELTDEFKLSMAKNIINAKVKNQSVILRRYARNQDKNADEAITRMMYLAKKMDACESTEEIMGYEGAAARIYFAELGKLIDPAFAFTGRNRRPPLDPFNSVISLGYSKILNEIYGKLEGKGLNPYFGILHKDREKHPTLASDLMEEWRAVLIDSIAMSMFNGHEFNKTDFVKDESTGAVTLEKSGFKTFLGKLENKLHADNNYLTYVDYRVSFRRAIDLQVNQLCKAIESDDPGLYKPIMIR